MNSPFRARVIAPVTMALVILLGGGAAADALKPSDVFLQGFMLLREVRKLEAAGQYAAAAQKNREAGEMYASIARRWPAWQAEMLETRRKKVREAQRRLDRVAADAAAAGVDGSEEGELSLPSRSGERPSVSLPNTQRPAGVATPPRAKTPRQKFQMLEREVERLRADRARLIRQSQDQADHSAAANRNLGLEREKVARLQTDLDVAKAKLNRLEGSGVVALQQQVEELTAQLSEATEKLKSQNDQTEKLLAAYESAQDQIAEMTLQTEELTQQRDEMAAIIKGLQTGESSLELVTENARLREQLNATQARVDQLEFDKLEDQAEIERLRLEVSQLRVELAQVKQENEAYKQRLLELQGSLDETNQELTSLPMDAENAVVRQENTMLRDIIERQLRQQAFRQQKRALMIEELQSVELGSDELIAKIDELVEEAPLSPEDRALLSSKRDIPGHSDPSMTAVPVLGGDSADRKISRFAEAAAYNYGMGRYESAAIHYEDILKFAPQHMETLCNLGVTRIHLNQVEEARGLFDRAILADEASSRAHFMHGVASYYLEDNESAVASLQKAIALEPNDVEIVSFLGVVHLVRANWTEAIQALASAVDLQPRHAVANYNLSYALLQQDRPDPKRALVHYNKAIKLGLAPNERMESYFRRLQEQTVEPPVESTVPSTEGSAS